jgi:hypothetical protein
MDDDFYTYNYENGEYVMKVCHTNSDFIIEE